MIFNKPLKTPMHLSLILGQALLLCNVAYAQEQGRDAQKWTPYADIEGKIGNKRDLGEISVFIPVRQSEDTLLFTDLRFRSDNNSSQEGNIGLGVRRMLSNGWNLGGYAYYDRRKTSHDNHVSQITIGAEALGADWDARINAYQPIGRKEHHIDGMNSATISGTSIFLRSGKEIALKGFDAEVGYRLPVFKSDDKVNLRIYAGGYHFSSNVSGVDDVSGPRVRLDLTYDDLPFAWQGSRLSVGLEWQRDDPRGTQSFLSVRLRIPFGASTGQSSLAKRRLPKSEE